MRAPYESCNHMPIEIDAVLAPCLFPACRKETTRLPHACPLLGFDFHQEACAF